MRFLSAVLFVALTGSVTLADEAKPADPKPEQAPQVTKRKVPLRVVKMLPETRQVLLFDKTKGTHVVAEVGQDVDGYLVDEIADDEVTLISETGSEVILTAPDQTWRRRAAERKAAAGKTAPAEGATAPHGEPVPEDPYAEVAPSGSPVSPHEDSPGPSASPAIVPGSDGVRVASAVDTSGMDPAIAAFVEAVGATPTGDSAASAAAPAGSSTTTAAPSTSATTTSSSSATAPSTSATTTSSATAAPSNSATPAVAASAGPTTAILKRADIDAALSDFSATASTFRASFTDKGLRFDDVSGGSLLARAGLAKGDVVTSVDGQPLRSLDDAANLYARLPTARGTTLQVLRAGKPVTLRISIQ